MLELGLKATIHSDDPAYFGGYVEQNLFETQNALELTKEDIYQLHKNAFSASFIPLNLKQQYLDELDQFHAHNI
jgi:adenosine deaminase